jgi:hypothetical protein
MDSNGSGPQVCGRGNLCPVHAQAVKIVANRMHFSLHLRQSKLSSHGLHLEIPILPGIPA